MYPYSKTNLIRIAIGGVLFFGGWILWLGFGYFELAVMLVLSSLVLHMDTLEELTKEGLKR